METTLGIIAIASLMGLILLALGASLIPVRLRVLLSADIKRLRVSFWKLTIVDSDSPARVSTRKSQKKEKKTTVAESSGEKTDTATERLSRFLKYLGIAPQITRALMGFTLRLLGKLRFNDVEGSVSGGLENPADTGMAFGALYAILGASPRLQSHLKLKPDYLAERMEYSFQGEIALRPLALVGPTFRLLHELPKRELFRIVRILRKRRKSAKSAS